MLNQLVSKLNKIFNDIFFSESEKEKSMLNQLISKLNKIFNDGIFSESEIDLLFDACNELPLGLRSTPKVIIIKVILYRFEQWEKNPKEVKEALSLKGKDRLNKLGDLSK